MASPMASPRLELDIPDEFFHNMEALHADIEKISVDDLACSQVIVRMTGRDDFNFLDEDEAFQQKLREGGPNASINVDKWARNRLNKFREFKGHSVSQAFEDLPKRECGTLLTKFFEHVCKKNGALYPTQTLMSFYRAFSRMLRRKQECEIMETGMDAVPFDMRRSPQFKSASLAVVLAMERSRKAGVNLPRKKARVISLMDERMILNHPCTSRSNSRGLQRRAVYYLLCRFAIRGGNELYRLEKTEFQFGSDNSGPFVRYDERLSKNYKVSMSRYQEEHFRPAVVERDGDVIATLQELIDHLPSAGVFLFCQCIAHPRTNAWYSTLRVSSKRLTSCLKEMHVECGLDVDGVTNKSGRTTCVTRMASEGVPAAIGMQITGHKNAGAYSRYDRSLQARVQAAQACVVEGKKYTEHLSKTSEAYKDAVLIGLGDSGDQNITLQVISSCEQNVIAAPVTEVEERKCNEKVSGDQKKKRNTSDDTDNEWFDEVNWDHHFVASRKRLRELKMVKINPISTILGKFTGNNNTVNINITMRECSNPKV